MRQKNPFKQEAEFAVWQNMKRKKLPMAEFWQSDYPRFKADVGPKPTPYSVLKRKNVAEGYFPSNVFWYDRPMTKLPPLPEDATVKDRIEQLRKHGIAIGRIIEVEDPNKIEPTEDQFGQDLDLVKPTH